MKFKNLIIAAAILLSTASFAFDIKSKPVTVVIPFAPGGGVDQTFRHFEKYALTQGITMVGMYKAGADGLIGMNTVSEMPKDGFHASVGTAGTVAIQQIKNPSATLTVLTGIRNSYTAFVVSHKSGIRSIEELESAIKAGSKISFGYGAPGQKMVLGQLFELTSPSVPPLMIPYKGGAPVVADLVGGHIDVAAVPLAIVKSQIDAGSVKLIALGAQSKLNEYPSIPLIGKKYPKWEDFDGFCFILPPGVDSKIVDTWSAVWKKYLSDPTVQKEFVKEYNESIPFGANTINMMIKSSVKRLSLTE